MWSGRWSFKLLDEIEITEADAVADFVVFFSVFTHLEEKESYRYLEEAKRVLKKNGTIVISFFAVSLASLGGIPCGGSSFLGE